MRKIIYLMIFCLVLGGCQPPEIPLFSVIDYKNEDKIKLNVKSFQVENETIYYTELPHIETRIPIVPATALKQALINRFTAVKPDTSIGLKIVIEEASLTQNFKESDKWYIQNNVEYRLDYQIRLIFEKNAIPFETQTVKGWEFQALPKRTSLSEKQQVWEKMINEMIKKITEKIHTDIPPILIQ